MRKSTTPPEWEIPNSDEVIDTRNIVQRMEDMRNEYQEWDGEESLPIPLKDWPAIASEEYAELHGVLDYLIRNSYGRDPEVDGITLVRESYFTEYVRQEYDDLYPGDLHVPEGPWGDTFRCLSWEEITQRLPFKFIDWDAVAAHDRKYYDDVTYHGVAYFFRKGA